MTNRTLNTLAAVSLIAVAVIAMPATAEAGRGSAWGAGLAGFGLGAIVGSTLTPRQVYVVPPPPPPAYYYGPVAYAPPPWTPDWYAYCGSRYRSFNARTGYFVGYDGYPHFCQ